MRCIVTAGPTYEPLDQVRRLTNFSTGRLGAELASFLASRGHDVVLLLGEQATFRPQTPSCKVEVFTTTTDLSQRLQAHASQPCDAVFHAAAVSDFGFGKIWVRSEKGSLSEIKSGKLSTRDGALLAELVPTPKIISQLRHWFPTARLIGWKFEVEGDRARVTELAIRQLTESHTDSCVANGPAYGKGFGLITPRGESFHAEDSVALFAKLESLLRVTAPP